MTTYLGILGGGNISETHLRAARELEQVKVAAVCGLNQQKVQQLAETVQAKAFTDLDAFLDHRPLDAVAIGSPSGLHAEQGIAAARKGLHVLVEKPIDVTVEMADRLIEECQAAKVKLGVFFQDRVAPDIVELKHLLDSGRLGKPLLVSGHVRWHRPQEYYRGSRWRGTWALDGGGALMNQGIHTVDLLLWLIGDVRRVYASTQTLYHDIEVEDTAVAALEFANGALGTLEAATSAFPGMPRKVVVSGTEGTATLEQDELVSVDLRNPSQLEGRAGSRSKNQSASSPLVSDVRGHRRILEDFLEAIRHDRRPLCDGREARRSVEVVRAIYASSSSGEPIGLATAG